MKARAVIATLVVLVMSIGVLAVGYVSTKNTKMTYSYALEDYYQRTFYELVNNVNDIELNLSKGMVANGKTTKLNAFETIEKDCATAISNLSRLPINHESINETTRLVNQLGGYSYYVVQKIKTDTSLSTTDTEQLDTLYDYTIKVQSSLNDFQKSINDNFSFIVEMMNTKNENKVSTNFSSLQSKATGIEYPTLIYDGPFSESVTNKKIKGLEDKKITKDEGKTLIWEKIGAKYTIDSVEYVSNTQSKFNTFDYKVLRKDLPTMYVQITEQGGMVLDISSTSSKGDKNYTLEECKAKAEEFAKILDFTELKAVWGTIINSTAYINLTTVVDNVVIYPEMIKVKVDIQTGNIIGWEAKNYAYNHIKRSNLSPKITASQARENVTKTLTIVSQRLSVIPKDYKDDVLCYEFVCKLNNYTYYVYINALDGTEENILRIVQTNDGELIE